MDTKPKLHEQLELFPDSLGPQNKHIPKQITLKIDGMNAIYTLVRVETFYEKPA